MIKKYFLSSIAALALGFVLSCDNSTEDPPNQNANGSSGATITGPRILSKITDGTKDYEEYITNAGILSQAFVRDAGSSNTLTSTVTYSGNKIATIKYQDNASPHVIDYFYTLTYTAGKLSGFAMDHTTAMGVNRSDFTVYYDAAGQLYRIVEKRKMGGSTAYTHYIESKFTFSGNNVVKADHTTMLMNSSGSPDSTTASVTSYAYENYDNKVNPYLTLPKEYFMVTGTAMKMNFYTLSSNNYGKMTIQSPAAPAVIVPKGYVYDSQNYPVSDQASLKYIYKPLQ